MDTIEGNYEQADMQVEQRALEQSQRIEADRIADVRRSMEQKSPESERTPQKEIQPEGPIQEKELRQRQLEELDREILERIERHFGEDIPSERLRLARENPTRFLDREDYEDHLDDLRDRGLVEPGSGNSRVLGDTRDVQMTVDLNHPELPRTLAHERLHQLADGSFHDRLGIGLDEGVSEYLSSRVSPDMHIQDAGESYSNERRVVEMLHARVGEKALSQAYFNGDWQNLDNQLEEQLGPGALEKVAQAVRSERYEEAERLLKG